MKHLLLSIFALLSSGIASAAVLTALPAPVGTPEPTPSIQVSQSPAVGQFDSYVLAITYENTFCRFNPKEKECRSAPKGPAMSLHGLWPDRNDDLKNRYQYCGPSLASLGKNWWCHKNIDVKDRMSSAEFEALAEVMPGVSSCLYNHEWYAHGTCSGMSVAEYFDDARELATRFMKLKSFQTEIANAFGQSVDRDTIFKALQADLGARVLDSASVNCIKDPRTGIAYFYQIDLGLDRSRLMDFPADDSLAPLKPYQQKDGKIVKDLGSCPEKGIVIFNSAPKS